MESSDLPTWQHPPNEQAAPDPMANDNLCGFDAWFNANDFSIDLDLDLIFGPQAPPTTPSPSVARARTRASLACIPCRRRHAKCDARSPACSQCRETGRQCSYAESRRGKAKPGVRRSYSARQDRDMAQPFQSASASDPPLKSQSEFLPVEQPLGNQTIASSSIPRASVVGDGEDDFSRYLSAYYAAFHDAHPFVLPRKFLIQRRRMSESSLTYLLPVMNYTGSFYVPNAPNQELRARAEALLADDDLPSNGFTVQALLIFAVAVHASHEFVRAREILDRAIREAMQIDMQNKSFASANGEGCAVLEESWRRTWWFLYLTDGLFAAIRDCSTFTLNHVSADVDLPCEEESYQLGVRHCFFIHSSISSKFLTKNDNADHPTPANPSRIQ